MNMKQNTNIFILFIYLQEVGSIIGKKGEIVKRFREEVRYIYNSIEYHILLFLIKFLAWVVLEVIMLSIYECFGCSIIKIKILNEC